MVYGTIYIYKGSYKLVLNFEYEIDRYEFQ